MKQQPQTITAKFSHAISRTYQTGGVMMTAIFVIVIMSILGITLVQLLWSNQDNHVRTILGTQAWFVAHSTNEWGLTQLYPLGEGDDAASVRQRCDNDAGGNGSGGINASWQSDESMVKLQSISHCKILSVQCQYESTEADYEAFQTFTITTVAECGDSDYTVERTQQVVSKGLME